MDFFATSAAGAYINICDCCSWSEKIQRYAEDVIFLPSDLPYIWIFLQQVQQEHISTYVTAVLGVKKFKDMLKMKVEMAMGGLEPPTPAL